MNQQKNPHRFLVCCESHPGQHIECISVDPDQESVFKCIHCISESEVAQTTLIPIDIILNSNPSTIFTNFPLTDRALSRELQNIETFQPTSSSLKQSISTYFSNLKQSLLDKLETSEAKMISQANSIQKLTHAILESYNRIAHKTLIKQIITDESKSISIKSTEIKSICQEARNNQAENKNMIQEQIEQLKFFQTNIDFETPAQIQNSLLNQLDSINIFSRINNQPIQINSNQYQPIQNQPPIIQQQQQPEIVQNLMKLISNKFNGISDEQTLKLEQQLTRMSPSLQSLEIPPSSQLHTHIDSLTHEQYTVITELITDFATRAPSFHIPHINQQREPLNATELVNLVSNKSNFCSKEYLSDITKVMNRIKNLLSLFYVRKPQIPVEKHEAYQNLSEMQLSDITQLVIKINQLTQQHGSSYENNQTPNYNIQRNSWQYRDDLLRIHTSLLSQEQKHFQSTQLDQILTKYPIFELLPQPSHIIPLPTTFSRTNYAQSQEISLQPSCRDLQISLSKNKEGQIVSNILDNTKAYLLKLKFNRPYGKEKHGYFEAGIALDSKIHSEHLLNNRREFGFNSTYNDGAKIITKGGRLSCEPHRSHTFSLEFRWCISRKLFYIADSTYSNINQGDPKHFNINEPYRFGIYLYNLTDNDWKLTITEFSEIEPNLLNQFINPIF